MARTRSAKKQRSRRSGKKRTKSKQSRRYRGHSRVQKARTAAAARKAQAAAWVKAHPRASKAALVGAGLGTAGLAYRHRGAIKSRAMSAAGMASRHKKKLATLAALGVLGAGYAYGRSKRAVQEPVAHPLSGKRFKLGSDLSITMVPDYRSHGQMYAGNSKMSEAAMARLYTAAKYGNANPRKTAALLAAGLGTGVAAYKGRGAIKRGASKMGGFLSRNRRNIAKGAVGTAAAAYAVHRYRKKTATAARRKSGAESFEQLKNDPTFGGNMPAGRSRKTGRFVKRRRNRKGRFVRT